MHTESLYEQVVSALPDALLLVRPNGTLTHLNTTAERMAGISFSQAKAKALSDLFPGPEELHKRLATTLKTGRSFTIREDEILNRAGDTFVAEIHIEPIHDDQGKVIGAGLIFRDLSAFKKMEEELRHADRLAVMGTIASGLAHEIKNPLGGIKGAAQMLTREVKRTDLREYLEIITKEADRVNQLILQLLNFAGPKAIRFSGVNINKLLDDLIQLEQTAEGGGVRFTRHYDPSLPKVKGDESQLKQAFLNLIKNAREAVKQKGSIEIKTWLVTDYQLKTEKGGKSSRMVGIDIIDTGCGMDDETLANLFAPFYTTKKGGTGLGLAISHRIISEHQGFIQVESSLKRGSTFRVFLRAYH